MNDDGDCCPRCGYELEVEDCWQCHGEGGRDLSDEGLEYVPGEWEDCDVCEGTGVTALCPNADCPGKSVQNEVTPMSGMVLPASVAETVPPQQTPQPDPGIRARRSARKRQRQNRQRGRQQHAH